MGLLLTATVAAAEPSRLDLKIVGLRSLKGNILICLTANGRAFPNCAKDAEAHKMTVPAAKAASVYFSDLAPGTYAVALIHDENANGKLDTALMIPREGFGFSNNPAIGFGPPKFAAARFTVGSGETTQSIKMKYMF
ncbi:DUF2141 domain-containing protein [Aquisediminimonas profunda]|uniref:DUF2141 domain-containing protein n=1 Tax=Aquisediminimonas profunda TaxID=1550733 RepID=UPI001FE92D73|nr:DUF2141 domain-containing protein [Aquisediminimonas profunda]